MGGKILEKYQPLFLVFDFRY